MPTIKVEIYIKEGIYLATSKDLPGLFVADRNFIDFINEIPEVIKAIYKEQNADIKRPITKDSLV